jgi:putative salt-induced outer membrane protein
MRAHRVRIAVWPSKNKRNFMKTTLLASAMLFALPVATFAADPPPPPMGWSGTGEAGLSIASGNTKSQNLNAKLDLKFNDDQWKDDFYLLAQRNKSNTTVTTVDTSTTPPSTVSTSKYDLTANRYEAGASFGYKIDERSYVVGAGRYEHDEFSPYDYQYTLSIGYGYQVLKNASDELAFEIGPGYKVVQPTSYITTSIDTSVQPNVFTIYTVHPDSDSNVVARGKMEYKHSFSDAVSFVDVLVVEAGSNDKFLQNDAGLAVKMNSHLALKVGLQTRHNSEVAPGFKKTDELFTTNLVYNF